MRKKLARVKLNGSTDYLTWQLNNISGDLKDVLAVKALEQALAVVKDNPTLEDLAFRFYKAYALGYVLNNDAQEQNFDKYKFI